MIADATRSDALAHSFIKKSLGIELEAPFCGYAIYDTDGGVVGAFAFTNYTRDNVELTVATTERLTLRVVRFMVYLAFVDLGCRRITARTRASNTRAIRAIEKSGAKREGVAREYFNGEDAILFGLLRNEQRLIKI